MSEAYFYFGLIIAFELMAVYFFAKQGFHWLNILLIANLIMVSISAKRLLNFPFGVSNAGNLFYAFIPIVSFLVVKQYGETAARRIVKKSILVLGLIVILRFLFISIPDTVEGNEVITECYRTVIQGNYLITAASFLAFYFSFIFALRVFELFENNKLIAYLAGMLVWQTVDSVIFFIVAFLNTWGELGKVWEYLWVGWLVKICIGGLTVCLVGVKELPRKPTKRVGKLS